MANSQPLGGEGFVNARGPVGALFAGATVTTITGTLVNLFALPGAWVGLTLSFLIGALFLFDEQVKRLVVRAILFVLNSLTVFSVAVGLNTAGQAAFAPVASEPPGVIERDRPRGGNGEQETSFFRDWF